MSTIYDELKKDHQKVLSLLDQLIASEGSPTDRRHELVQQIRDELIPHARAEEAILYNALRDHGQETDKVIHAYGEHAEAEAVLRAIQLSDGLNVNWVEGMKKLRDSVAHHIHEEETKVFAAARRTFQEHEARQMGEAFTRMKPIIKDETIVGTTLDMIANLLPTRLRPSFLKHNDEQKADKAPTSRRAERTSQIHP